MDKKKKDRPESPRAALPEMREVTLNEHKILIPTDEQNKRLSVDGRTVYYAINARGEYYLDKYPYNPAKSLDEVIKRYVNHLDAAAKSRKEGN
jgi:hypothetical protein